MFAFFAEWVPDIFGLFPKIRYKTIDPNQNLSHEVSSLCSLIFKKAAKYNYLILLIEEIEIILLDFATWAWRYDHKNVQANGYWSWIRFFIRYFHLVLQKIEDDEVDHEIISIAKFCLIWLKHAQQIHEEAIKLNGNNPIEPLNLINPSSHLFSEVFRQYLDYENDNEIAAIYGKHFGFWLAPGPRLLMTHGHLGMVIINKLARFQFLDVIRTLKSPKFRALNLVECFKQFSIEILKEATSISEKYVLTNIGPSFWNGLFHPNIRKEVFVPRQTRWIICQRTGLLKENKRPMFNDKKPINCIILVDKPKRLLSCADIIINCHGGSFTGGCAATNEMFLRNWANKLQGTAILSIGYSLSPENKFPVALQEVLDVYLWLTNDDGKAEVELGFRPSEVILTGDSSGGNLVTALCFCLNDMKKLFKDGKTVQMPLGILPMFTSFSFQPHLTPSMLMTVVDPLVIPASKLIAMDAYLQLDGEFPSTKSYAIVDKWNWFKFFLDPFHIFRSYGRLSGLKYTKPWYYCSKQRFIEYLKRFEMVAESPYITLLNYKHLDDLSNIKLYLIVSHFDPVLDQSVTMANRWKGPVTLDVFDGLTHAFPRFIGACRESTEANNIIINRIKECLNI